MRRDKASQIPKISQNVLLNASPQQAAAHWMRHVGKSSIGPETRSKRTTKMKIWKEDIFAASLLCKLFQGLQHFKESVTQAPPKICIKVRVLSPLVGHASVHCRHSGPYRNDSPRENQAQRDSAFHPNNNISECIQRKASAIKAAWCSKPAVVAASS